MKYAIVASAALLAGLANPIAAQAMATEIDAQATTTMSFDDAYTGDVGAVGSQVRWGGVVSRVRWQGDAALLLVEERVLKRNGKPTTRATGKAFVVELSDVERPGRIAVGRRFTANGEVTRAETVKVEGEVVTLPVVSSAEWRSWRSEPTAVATGQRRFAYANGFNAYPYYGGLGFRRFGRAGFRGGFYPYGFRGRLFY
ncbi:MAG: Slp family lipoprotein [Pseudomonadota bacterium]